MNEKLSALVSVVLCSVFGVCHVAEAKTTSTETTDRALQKSIQRQGMVSIPGVGVVRLSDPVYPGSNFNWGEVTRGGARIPRDTWYRGELVKARDITLNAIELAKELDLIRIQFGNRPIIITSWYRPPEVNGSTPGAGKDSYHQIGHAADFRINGVSTTRIYRELNPEWEGGLGKYSAWIHVDLRHLRGDNLARW